MNKKYTETFRFPCDPTHLATLRSISEKSNVPISAIIRRAIKEFLDKQPNVGLPAASSTPAHQ